MSKVLPLAIRDRPELNLRQGIKSSLNNWRQLLSSLYLFFLYVRDGGSDTYCKEIHAQGRTALAISDSFARWLTLNWSSIPSIDKRLAKSPLFLAQMEHLQVGLELFLKLAKVEFADIGLADASERTGGSRYCKKLHFSTNMKIYADAISKHKNNEITTFLDHWLSNTDDSPIGEQVKEILVSFTEECQYKIRTNTGEVYFQQNGVYERLRNPTDTVESSDAHEPVGPFRILKSFIKEGMHPYLIDSSAGFKVKSDINTFSQYADLVNTSLMLIPKRTTVIQEVADETPSEESETQLSSRQLIIYGAPGTGKSWRIKNDTKGMNVIRTTFHPDSDYSTFVGAYKPSMSDDAGRVEVYKGSGGSKVLDATHEIKKGISYEFIPQAFIKAYVLAWKKMNKAPDGEGGKPKPEPVFLVIEEINRGNCAQIFGDIFQLLDRNDAGYSEYPIDADEDLKKFLSRPDDKGGLGGLDADAISTKFGVEKKEVELIRDGKHLMLPPNLLIRATMNTSDQSLFPIDSAFKRRWEWEYVPIEDANKNWKIDVGGVKYKWWSFLEKINYLIATETSSEDKQLGYFFVKAKDTMIDAETFVSKVVFFLWGDVFKDNLPDEDVFKYTFKKDGKDDKRLIRFADFYHPEPGNTKEEWRNKLLTSFLEALKVEKEPPADNDSGQGSSNANGDDAKADE